MESSSCHSSKHTPEILRDHCTTGFHRSEKSLPGWAWLYRLIRTVLGIIFIWSGFSKFSDPQSFAIIIESYGLLPEATSLPAAYGLSMLELVAGIGLVLDVQWSLGLVAGLLFLFLAVLGYGLRLGLDVDCGCFGPDDPEARAYHSLRPALYRDMIMLAGIGYLFFWRWRYSVRPVRFSDIYQTFFNIKRRK